MNIPGKRNRKRVERIKNSAEYVMWSANLILDGRANPSTAKNEMAFLYIARRYISDMLRDIEATIEEGERMMARAKK